MSTFAGHISDLPEFSIDRFDGDNLKSTTFFLSHCHSDHMNGLSSPEFNGLLDQNPDYFLYMSPVSASILLNIYPAFKDHIKTLDIYTSVIISNVVVWTIPAGHCPGSVMFLFETENKRILYTGDFRINLKHLDKIKAFKTSLNFPKTIDDIYLDTTFFYKEYKWFPSRDESLAKICDIIQEQFNKNPTTAIELVTCARYGYEFLFIEIYKRFKMPIYIYEEQVYKFYLMIPEMQNAVTNDFSKTRIFIGNITNKYLLKKIYSIRISAWKWTSECLEDGISDEISVCYSTHPSYDECVEFIKFFKPKKVEPNVIQEKFRDILYSNIKECLESFQEESKNLGRTNIKLFKIEQSGEKKMQKDKYMSSLLDSPPSKRKLV